VIEHRKPGSDDLTADLLADMDREQTRPVLPVPRRSVAERGASEPPSLTVSSQLRVSPYQWRRPSLGLRPDGIVGDVGPVHLELFFR